jgi:hypothetical protein
MANSLVSTISALADIIKDEMKYKTVRDLANKKETLMTQFRRVGLKVGSKAADYHALRAPLLGSSQECTDITKDIIESTTSTTFSDNNCYVITNDNDTININEKTTINSNLTINSLNSINNTFNINKPTTINGNLTLTGYTNIYCFSDLTINGNLTLTTDTQLYVYNRSVNVLSKIDAQGASVNVLSKIDAQGASGITVGVGGNLKACTLKFSGEQNNNLAITYAPKVSTNVSINNIVSTTPNTKSNINVVKVDCSKGISYIGETLNALNGKAFVSSRPSIC